MIEVTDRFEMGRALGSVLTGLHPLVHRARGIAGGSQMMGQKFGLALDEIHEMLFQHRCDAGVQFLASGSQQGAVGSVLDQCVLE